MKTHGNNCFPNLRRRIKNLDELARIICKEETTVSKSLNGKREFTAKEKDRISEHFGIPKEILFIKGE